MNYRELKRELLEDLRMSRFIQRRHRSKGLMLSVAWFEGKIHQARQTLNFIKTLEVK